MLKKELFIIVLLLTSIGVWAQRDYRKGYIITNEQDTIYGWVDYRGDVRNAKVCSFKKSETGQATEYTPLDIAAYRYIDSKYYVSKNIGTVDAPIKVFFEYLVDGMAKLYYYRDNNTKGYYYIEKDEQLIELSIDEKEVEINGRAYNIATKSYIGVLKATLNVWEMGNKIDKAKLEHESLINIAKDYHQYVCTDGSECIIYEKKKPLMALRIAPVAGVELSTLKLKNSDVQKYSFDPSANLTIGVNLNFSMPRLNEKIFLQIQAMYTKYYFFETHENSISVTDVHFRSNVLQMGLAVKYEYPKGKIRPILAAGASFINMPDGEIEEVKDIFFSGGVVRTSTNKSAINTKFMPGFEVIPGIHYYIAKERIIFIQLQYFLCKKREYLDFPANSIQSYGLSAGIYF